MGARRRVSSRNFRKPLRLILATLIIFAPAAARGITYLTDEEALALAFEEGTQVEKQTHVLGEAGRARYADVLGVEPEPGTEYEIFVGTKEGKPTGFALILTEASRYRPITFLVALNPAGEVRRVEVMVYREPRGGEVRKRRFLEQYEGKTGTLHLGREVLSISGATVSAQVMTYGVSKAAFLVREFFLRQPPAPPAKEPSASTAEAPPKKEGA